MARRAIPSQAAIPLLAACILLAPAVHAQENSGAIQPIIAALRSQNNSRALALCQELTHSQPRNPRLWTLEGMALGGLGRNKESLASFKRALAIDPDYVPALEGAAQLQFQLSMPAAEPYLQTLVRLNPQNSTAHAMLGALAFRRKNCPLAVAHFEKSRGAISSNVLALGEFGACLLRQDRPDASVPVFERIVDLRPRDWHSQYNLALALFRARRYANAIRTLLPITEGPSANATALNLAGAAYESNGQTPQAVAALRQAMALAPRDADNYLDLATICLDHASFSVGVDVLKAGLRILPGSAPLHLELGVLLVQLGRFEDADAEFRQAAALQPAQNAGAVALSISLLQENKPGESLELVRRRLSRDPGDPVLNYLLAEILLRKGIQPGTPEFREAVAAAKRSVRRKPDFATAQDTLAELYLREGGITRAAAASRLALKADPTDQAALYHLVICARRGGEREQAAPLAARLARVAAAAQKRTAARDRFRLVEQGPGSRNVNSSY